MSVTDRVTLAKPVLLENCMAGPTVFKDEISKVEITWEGNSDPMGRSVQAVPLAFLENPHFLRILNRGVLRLFDADDDVKVLIEQQLNNPVLRRQAESWQAARIDRGQETAQYMEPPKAKNEYVTAGCIGPNTQGNGSCGAQVPMREFGSQSKPPLCPTHAELAPYCIEVPTEQLDPNTGKETFSWKLASLAR